MNRLFDIVNGKVIMNPTALWLPQFKKVWDRDKSKYKSVAVNEISYIVFRYGFHSPYAAYSEDEMEKKIIGDFFPDNPNWQPDKDLQIAIKKYNELQDSVALRALRAAKIGLDKTNEYFLTATSDKASEILKIAKDLGPTIKSIDMLTKQVEKEQLENSSIRGGEGIGLFEM